jgi:hypothetical protein
LGPDDTHGEASIAKQKGEAEEVARICIDERGSARVVTFCDSGRSQKVFKEPTRRVK